MTRARMRWIYDVSTSVVVTVLLFDMSRSLLWRSVGDCGAVLEALVLA